GRCERSAADVNRPRRHALYAALSFAGASGQCFAISAAISLAACSTACGTGCAYAPAAKARAKASDAVRKFLLFILVPRGCGEARDASAVRLNLSTRRSGSNTSHASHLSELTGAMRGKARVCDDCSRVATISRTSAMIPVTRVASSCLRLVRACD